MCIRDRAYGIGIVSPQVIDEINILQATYEAMRQAISQLNVIPEILLNDAVTIPGVDIMQVPIVKGDAKSVSIAAASILALSLIHIWELAIPLGITAEEVEGYIISRIDLEIGRN